MYGAFDKDMNLIAYHDRRKVVEKYVYYVSKHHKEDLAINKIKKSSEDKLILHDDLYLVKCGETYVQAGYTQYVELAVLNDDTEYALDVLDRIIRVQSLTEKEFKVLCKAIKVLHKINDEERTFVPTLYQLKKLKMDYDPYIYNTRVKYDEE